MTLVGCMNHDDATSVNIPLDKNAINENAKNIFGEIDPNQDWSSTTQGQVTIKADANLEDIEKIQILTESPTFTTSSLLPVSAKVESIIFRPSTKIKKKLVLLAQLRLA